MSEYRDSIERYMDAGYSRYQAEREAAIDAIGYVPRRRVRWIDSRDPAYDDTSESEANDET
jgi:hypothetical protein